MATPPSADQRSEMSKALAYSQLAMEMVAPMVLGLIVDGQLGTRPWGTVIGILLGFLGSMTHLLLRVARDDRSTPSRKVSPPTDASE